MVDPNALAGMAFTLILAAMIGGFVLLFPLSRRLGQLLERKLSEKRGETPPDDAQIDRLWTTIESLQEDVRRLSERQEFTERMLEEREASRLPASGAGAASHV